MPAKALAGVRVADFSWVGVGPFAAKYLADHGAEVIKIESLSHLDQTRLHPPFKDDRFELEYSANFAMWNSSKLSATLNLSNPKARELAKRLVAISDVVTESFTPRVMKKWGLDYEELRQVKPDIIMISMTTQGQTGPHALHPGAGGTLPGLIGLTNLTGWPDRAPVVGPPYTDWIATQFSALAILGALAYREETGQGQYIDLSQTEASIHALAPTILDFTANGREQERRGNRHPSATPHRPYPCQGENRTSEEHTSELH